MKQPFEILHRISSSISKANRLEEIYEIILNEIVEALGVERASIMRYEPKAHVLKIVAAKGIDPTIWGSIEISVGEGVSGQVWQEGKPLLIKKMKSNPRYKTHSYMITPVTAFPMKVRSLPMGLINLTDKKSGKPFTEQDLKLLTLLSDQVAAYMHIYDLADRLQAAEQDKIQLEVAREIQQKLLPKNIPSVAGLEVEGRLIPAEKVGADYYDYLEDGGICIADVSGHGVGGAMLAFALRSYLRAHSRNGTSPNLIVEQTNKILFSDLLQSEQFISLFYARYSAPEKKIKFTNAGHNPPLLWKKKNQKCEWLLTQDSLLGIDSNLNFHAKEAPFETGDVLILYTDGLTEALGAKSERFGTARLSAIIPAVSEKGAGKIIDQIFAEWKKFIGKETVRDDVTVVVVKST